MAIKKCEICAQERADVEIVLDVNEFEEVQSYGPRDRHTGEYTNIKMRKQQERYPIAKCGDCR